MIKKEILKIIDGFDLTVEESFDVMSKVMTGEVKNPQIASLLTSLKCKGESPTEVAGFAKAMKENGIKIKSLNPDTIDVCGTGGDNSGTFNISTAAAFVAAGAGANVAKHGNRSISSKSGSSDVLTELGVNINLKPEQAEEALEKIGITFLFAPLYHPAMKHVAGVRKELGFKTIFNILGPLTNPANTKKQMIGTFDFDAANLMAKAAEYLEMERICFICTENKFDEITLSGETKVVEYNAGEKLKNYSFTSETFDYPIVDLKNIKGDSAAENSKIILSILENRERNDAFYVVAANAAMGLFASGFSQDLIKCKEAAEESIMSGKAYNKLLELINFGKSV
jgi:anthranilate phosphoribosyltransferase